MLTLEIIANEWHKPARKSFRHRKDVTRYKDEFWQADLIDVQSQSKRNRGFKQIVIVIRHIYQICLS